MDAVTPQGAGLRPPGGTSGVLGRPTAGASGEALARPAEDLAAMALALARRFAAGATLWCVAPEWPAHGRHVAVEFVHPVVVGARALPAVHVEGPDPAGALRLLARPGDAMVVVAAADDPVARDVLRRAPAWGLARLWLGAGPRPPSGLAEHTAWLDTGAAPVAARDGDAVMLYHLLWELTHVVFEHPGLLAEPPDCTGEVCVTCSDDGQVGEIRAVGEDGTAEAVVAGRAAEVDVRLVGPVAPGDLVLVHAGVALTILEEAER